MRDIKFRQYDKGLSKFLFFELNNARVNIINNHIESYDVTRNGSPQEQYTGLKDSKGVEIYEGDITKKSDDKFTKTGIVSFVHGCWMVVSKDSERYYNLHWHLNQTKVIGNLHQNPDLLEQSA